MKWEYKRCGLPYGEEDLTLLDLGESGWELCGVQSRDGVVDVTGGCIAYFKRPLASCNIVDCKEKTAWTDGEKEYCERHGRLQLSFHKLDRKT